MTTRQPPRFSGVTTYRDPLGRFSLRFPTDWHQFDVEGKEGVMYLPSLDDPETSFAAWVSQLEHAVVAEDLEELKIGVDEGLAQLTDSNVEAASEVVLGNLIKFERIFTFHQGEAIRRRKIWILYVDTWLIVLTWQGSSPEEYEYWFSMANYSFATFLIPEALWFATDRDLVGLSRP